MKIKSLFSLSLAAMLFGAANASEVYLIKDGKFADGVEVLSADADSVDTAVEDVAPDGTPAVKITHVKKYQDLRFYLADGVDLTTNYKIAIEYYYGAGEINTADFDKKPIFVGGVVEDTIPLPGSETGRYGLDDAFTRYFFDVKFMSPGDEWKEESYNLFLQPTMTQAKLFTLGCMRELDMSETKTSGIVYVKNLKVFGTGNRPYFSENFDHFAELYDEFKANVHLGTIDATGAYKAFAASQGKDINACYSGLIPVITTKTAAASKTANTVVNVRRLYEDNGTDGSEYYDDVNYFALEVINGGTRFDSRNLFFVPTTGLDASTTSSTLDFISKWDAKKGPEGLTEDTGIDSLGFAVEYAFVDDYSEAASVAFTKIVNKNSEDGECLVAGEWTAYSANIPMDLTKKYLVLSFSSNPYFSYMVDNLMLTADNCTLAGATVGDKGVEAYVTTPHVGVETVKVDSKIALYPNPATNEIVVTNEGVNRVSVLSLAGAEVASSNSAKVNVSNLAKGVYIVKAYTAEGVVSGSIIKK